MARCVLRTNRKLAWKTLIRAAFHFLFAGHEGVSYGGA